MSGLVLHGEAGRRELSGYTFRRLAMTEVALVNDLYNRCYQASRSIGEAEWLYERNPYGEGVIFGAFDAHNRLVGVRPTIAWRFLWNGREQRAYQFTDAVVAPEHRGKGIFTRLVTSMCAWAEACEVGLYSFPNDNSLPIYLKSGSIEQVATCQAQVKVLAWDRYLRYKLGLRGPAVGADAADRRWREGLVERETCLVPIGRFESDFADIEAELSRGVTSLTLRRRDFLNWRYFESPERQYRAALVEQGGRPGGYVVLTVVNDIAHVIDLFLRPDRGLTSRVPRLVTGWARQMGAAALYFEASKGHVFQRAFDQNGFLLKRKTGRVVLDSTSVRHLGAARARPLGPEDVYFVMGDSDGK